MLTNPYHDLAHFHYLRKFLGALFQLFPAGPTLVISFIIN